MDEGEDCLKFDITLVSSVYFNFSARSFAMLARKVLNCSDTFEGSTISASLTVRELVNEGFCLHGNKERKISQIFLGCLKAGDDNNFFRQIFLVLSAC